MPYTLLQVTDYLQSMDTARTLYDEIENLSDPLMAWCTSLSLPICSECILFAGKLRAILYSALQNHEGIPRRHGVKYPELAEQQRKTLVILCQQLATFDLAMVTKLFLFMGQLEFGFPLQIPTCKFLTPTS